MIYARKNLPFDTLTKHEIVYGVVYDLASCITLNHLILIGKYFVLLCRKKSFSAVKI